MKLSLPKQRRAPSKIIAPHKFCSKAYSPQEWGYYPQACKFPYRNWAAYMERENQNQNNTSPPPGPMALTWNLHQGRFMFKKDATLPQDIEVSEDEAPPTKKDAPLPQDIEVSEDEAPPTKKARTVVHGSTPAPVPAPGDTAPASEDTEAKIVCASVEQISDFRVRESIRPTTATF